MATHIDTPIARALVVEDAPTDQRLVGAWLESSEVRWEAAADARAALDALERRTYDVVLLDLDLGEGTDGFSLLANLRSRPETKDLPVVIVTGARGTPARLARGFALGADDYLTKPVDARLLRTTLARLLKKRAVPARSPAAASRRDKRDLVTLPAVPAVDGAIMATGAMMTRGEVPRAAFDVVVGRDRSVRVALFDAHDAAVDQTWLEHARDEVRARFDLMQGAAQVLAAIEARARGEVAAMILESDPTSRRLHVASSRMPGPVLVEASGLVRTIRPRAGEVVRLSFPPGTAIAACTHEPAALAERMNLGRFGPALAAATRDQLSAVLAEHTGSSARDAAMVLLGHRSGD